MNRNVLERAFGDCLLTTLEEYNKSTSARKRGSSSIDVDEDGENEQKAGDTVSNSSCDFGGGGGLEAIVGDDTTGGKLQVIRYNTS